MAVRIGATCAWVTNKLAIRPGGAHQRLTLVGTAAVFMQRVESQALIASVLVPKRQAKWEFEQSVKLFVQPEPFLQAAATAARHLTQTLNVCSTAVHGGLSHPHRGASRRTRVARKVKC